MEAVKNTVVQILDQINNFFQFLIPWIEKALEYLNEGQYSNVKWGVVVTFVGLLVLAGLLNFLKRIPKLFILLVIIFGLLLFAISII